MHTGVGGQFHLVNIFGCISICPARALVTGLIAGHLAGGTTVSLFTLLMFVGASLFVWPLPADEMTVSCDTWSMHVVEQVTFHIRNDRECFSVDQVPAGETIV